jgi:outer membrane immunogenic protein
MKKFLLAGAAIVVMASAASAADLPARTYTKTPVLASPAYNWTGFYAGVHGGYGWSDEVTVGITGIGAVTGSTDELKGGFGGGQIGYNWQLAPSWVWGLEVDAAGSGIKWGINDGAGTSVESKIRAFGSVTGRIGYAADNVLIYAKGGWGWADNRISATLAGVGSASDSQTHSGWTIGGGLEYGFAPAWSAKVEYQYYDFGTETYGAGLDLGAKIHTVKGGINYHFNWGGPVVARY